MNGYNDVNNGKLPLRATLEYKQINGHWQSFNCPVSCQTEHENLLKIAIGSRTTPRQVITLGQHQSISQTNYARNNTPKLNWHRPPRRIRMNAAGTEYTLDWGLLRAISYLSQVTISSIWIATHCSVRTKRLTGPRMTRKFSNKQPQSLSFMVLFTIYWNFPAIQFQEPVTGTNKWNKGTVVLLANKPM